MHESTVYKCMYVYVFIYVYIYICIYIYVWVCIYIYIYPSVYIYTHTHIYIYTRGYCVEGGQVLRRARDEELQALVLAILCTVIRTARQVS